MMFVHFLNALQTTDQSGIELLRFQFSFLLNNLRNQIQHILIDSDRLKSDDIISPVDHILSQ